MKPTVIEKCYGVLVTCEDGREWLAFDESALPYLGLDYEDAVSFGFILKMGMSKGTCVKVVPIKATFEVLEKTNAE